MKIGELARRTGISVRMLRYYEEQGVLSPGRRSSGYRDYDVGDLKLMRVVKRLQGAGLPITTILEIMPCIIEKEMTITECPMVIATLEDAKDRIRRKISELQLSEASLENVIGSIGLPLFTGEEGHSPASQTRAATSR